MEARAIVSTAAGVALTAVIVQAAAELGNFGFGTDLHALNADEEFNAFAWASSVSTFAAAFFLFIPAAAAGMPDRLTVLLAGAIAFLSLDDAIGLHERLAERSIDVLDADVSLQRVVWPLVYLPLLAFVFIMLWRMASEPTAPISTALKAGLFLLVAAIFAELTSALYVEEGVDTWASAFEVSFEEGAELAGWILIAGGLAALAYLHAERGRRA